MPSDHTGQHLATISGDGRFWEVFLEFEERPDAGSARARLRFAPADSDGGAAALRTGLIFVEATREAVLARARLLDAHQLDGLLRSCLPDPQAD